MMDDVYVVIALGETFPMEVEAFRSRDDAESCVIGLARQYCGKRDYTYQEARDELRDIWQERASIWKTKVQ